jgi:hypothetical protein
VNRVSLGIVGIGTQENPPLIRVIPPNTPSPIFDDQRGDPPKCLTIFGGGVKLTLSGVVPCGTCFYLGNFSGTNAWLTVTSVTGLNVLNTLTYSGGIWTYSGGTLNFSISDIGDPSTHIGDCSSYAFSGSTPMLFEVSCDDASRSLGISVSAPITDGGVVNTSVNIFSASNIPFSASAPNSIVCTSAPLGNAIGGGTGTITP